MGTTDTAGPQGSAEYGNLPKTIGIRMGSSYASAGQHYAVAAPRRTAAISDFPAMSTVVTFPCDLGAPERADEAIYCIRTNGGESNPCG